MDQIDKNILFQLQNQARLSMTDLGKLVSQPTVARCLKLNFQIKKRIRSRTGFLTFLFSQIQWCTT